MFLYSELKDKQCSQADFEKVTDQKNPKKSIDFSDAISIQNSFLEIATATSEFNC